ncbi:hypothetical protein B0J13DRAFT_517268 [Dactylonectria estremocensis]|uniref:Uncharacterized protein n=1 Tax=Dactylonectria estremocensis TaxID=1079267 RepID=A0A9P9FH39_9HYPO|nr:hypothetical protein B0J13DRAFT_517268 [Dactylonectria estremocensis]
MEAVGQVSLLGLYSYTSPSYACASLKGAVESLAGKIGGCLLALQTHSSMLARTNRELTIGIGARPQAALMQNFAETVGDPDENATQLRQMMQQITTSKLGGFKIKFESHAGVYSVSDIQQLATNARNSLVTVDNEVATFVMAEVCSAYTNGQRQHPKALVAVETFGLGCEPCLPYIDWGIGIQRSYSTPQGFMRRRIIERISQEHSVVT